MLKNPSNIVLIGMPGSGKSTVGIILAKLTSRDFVDTDVLIQTSQGRTLQDIVDTEGYMVLREIEERILLKLDCFNHVIATGGSAVYSHAAMTNLKSNGVVVFLNVDLPVLESRIHDFATRGLAKRPDQSIEKVWCAVTDQAEWIVQDDRRIQDRVITNHLHDRFQGAPLRHGRAHRFKNLRRAR